MGIDLEKLTPADWSSVQAVYPDSLIPTKQYILAHGLKQLATFESETDCDFAALARAAFDVTMRRKWWVRFHDNAWAVRSQGMIFPTRLIHMRWPDPFTALVEADKWFAANVEGKADGI